MPPYINCPLLSWMNSNQKENLNSPPNLVNSKHCKKRLFFIHSIGATTHQLCSDWLNESGSKGPYNLELGIKKHTVPNKRPTRTRTKPRKGIDQSRANCIGWRWGDGPIIPLFPLARMMKQKNPFGGASRRDRRLPHRLVIDDERSAGGCGRCGAGGPRNRRARESRSPRFIGRVLSAVDAVPRLCGQPRRPLPPIDNCIGFSRVGTAFFLAQTALRCRLPSFCCC